MQVIFKYKYRECNAKGINTYEVEEVIDIPKGIKTGTNIRFSNRVYFIIYI